MVVKNIVATLPILSLFLELLFMRKENSTLKVSIHTLCISILLTLLVWNMPVADIGVAIAEGIIMSIWPISTVVIAAVFLYNICNTSGAIKIIRDTLSVISNDRRIMTLLIVWGFGGFIEGVAGFGISIAVASSMLVAIGYSPFIAVLLSLIANPVPSVFGSFGVQMPTLSQVTGISSSDLAVYSSYAIIPLVLFTPFILVFVTAKNYNTNNMFRGVLKVSFAGSIGYALAMLITVEFISQDLTGVIGAIIALGAMILVATYDNRNSYVDRICDAGIVRKQVVAWLPFILCILFLIITSKLISPVYELLSAATITARFTINGEISTYSINLFTTAPIWIFISAIIGGLIQNISLKQQLKILFNTIQQMWKTIATLMVLLSISRLMTHSGMIVDVANLLIYIAGDMFPLFVPLLGSIGAFITGSATSANVLLGSLQVSAANNLGGDPVWFMAFSIAGGTIGKMMSPQSIAMGISAVGIKGKESLIFKKLLKWYCIFLLLLIMVGIVCL